MLLLAADTSGKQGTIALVRLLPPSGNHQGADQRRANQIESIDVVSIAGGTFSAQLVPQIAALLSKHGFKKEDISAFAVASGPGSFTGLRVGLAAIKALAEVTGKPIAAVSMLEAVARAGHISGRIMAALDAGRAQVYAGEYEIKDEATMLSERLLTIDEFVTAAPGCTVVTPDQNVADQVRGAGLAVREIERPRSDAIARLGWRKILAGTTVSSEDLEANYIRRFDGEIVSNRHC
jgi:tRNA threonylcarbamoyladenosine biosynthesis protein TsaB